MAYDREYNQAFDYLIKELTDDLTKFYINNLNKRKEFQNNDIDTSPLLNMTLSVFVSALINILDVIKSHTEGEKKLMTNIDDAKKILFKAIHDMPFIKGVEEMN